MQTGEICILFSTELVIYAATSRFLHKIAAFTAVIGFTRSTLTTFLMILSVTDLICYFMLLSSIISALLLPVLLYYLLTLSPLFFVLVSEALCNGSFERCCINKVIMLKI